MHTNRCVLIEISMDIGMLNFLIWFDERNLLYLLKSFLLYQTLLWWKQIKCIHVKIESRCKLRNKLIEKLVFCRALQKGTTPFIRYTWFESFYGFTSFDHFNTNSKLLEYQKICFTMDFCHKYVKPQVNIFNSKLGKIHST